MPALWLIVCHRSLNILLKDQRRIKAFSFSPQQDLKNKKTKGVGWGETDDSFWPQIKYLESNQSLVTEAYKDLNTLENKFEEEIQDRKFLYLLDIVLCLDIVLYVSVFTFMVADISSDTTEEGHNEKTKCVCYIHLLDNDVLSFVTIKMMGRNTCIEQSVMTRACVLGGQSSLLSRSCCRTSWLFWGKVNCMIFKTWNFIVYFSETA